MFEIISARLPLKNNLFILLHCLNNSSHLQNNADNKYTDSTCSVQVLKDNKMPCHITSERITSIVNQHTSQLLLVKSYLC